MCILLLIKDFPALVTTIKPRREGEKRVSGMKKVLILGSVILAMCGVTSCGSAKQETGEETAAETAVSETETGEDSENGTERKEIGTEESTQSGQIISISMAEMEEKLNAGETFLVSFVTIECPYCQEFHSMLVDYVETHAVTMYQVILDYEETSEEENRARIAELFPEFNTVPGVFYVVDGEDGSYLDTYHLGVGETAFDDWVQENEIEAK